MSLQLYRIDQVNGARLLGDETAVYEAITTRSNCDLGPCWPGLHVMLTGGEPPMPRYIALQQELDWDDDSFENVLMGGDPTQYEDALGFARYLAPSTVRKFGARLEDLSVGDFVERFDDDVLEYIPSGWDAARARPELAARFGELVACYRLAASSGDGLLFYTS